MTLRPLPGAFSDPDWLFEIKHDGFRSLAYVLA
jgi:ATP-dependent DNA ligase